MRLVTAAVSTFIGVLGTTLHAQDLEPARLQQFAGWP